MTEIGFGRDLVDFLLKAGRITHLISAGKDKPMPITALMQRALAAGLTHVVPVDEERVAIFAPDGIPSSLSIFGIVATDLRAAEPQDRGKPTIAAMLDEIEGRLAGSDVQRGKRADAAGGASSESGGAPDAAASAQGADTATVLAEVKRGLADVLGRPALDQAAVSEIVERTLAARENPVAALTGMIETLLAKAEGSAETDRARDDAILARLEALEASGAPGEALARMERQIERLANTANNRAQNAELKAVMARFSTALATVLNRLDSVSDGLTDAVPGPQGSELKTVVSEALEETGLAALSAKLEAVGGGPDAAQPGADSGAIGAGLSDIARALAEGTERREVAATELLSREIGEIASLQHAIVTQLAALVDKRGEAPRNGTEEFLTDLRHAIAEIFADEKRKRLMS